MLTKDDLDTLVEIIKKCDTKDQLSIVYKLYKARAGLLSELKAATLMPGDIIRCLECECEYYSDESECPECGSEDWEEVEKVVVRCSHCGAKAFGDAYCNRCGNRVHYDYNHLETDSMDFADPGGNSALRAASPSNPKIYPCPDCGTPDVLTSTDKARGYCCDRCADRKERGWDY